MLEWVQGADEAVVRAVQGVRTGQADAAFTFASEWWVRTLLFFTVAALVDLRRRAFPPWALVATVLAFAVAAGATVIAKDVVGRARPPDADAAITPVVALPDDPSMPSGHASTAFAAAVALGYIARRLLWPALAAAAVIAASRVYLGVHFPTDVLAGAALGAVAGALTARAVVALAEATDRRGAPAEAGAEPRDGPRPPPD